MAGESIIFEIGGDNSNFVREMGRTKDYARSSAATIDREISNIGRGARIGEVFTKGALAAGSLVAGVAIATAAMEKLVGVADKFGHIQDLSERTGLSPEFLQALGRAADQSGTSIDTVAKGVSKFAKELINAKDGDDFTKKIEALGLSVEELRGLKPEEIFSKVATAIADIPDPTARSAAAMDAFGKSGAELIPIMGSVGDALKTVDVLSANQVARLDEMGDAWTALSADFSTTAGALLSDVAPAITATINLIREAIASWRALGMVVEGITSGKSFGDAFEAADDFYNKKIDEIRNPPEKAPKTDAGESDSSNERGGGPLRGGTGDIKAPKIDISKTRDEKAWEEYQSDPAKMQEGEFRNPAEARRIKRRAERSRERADNRNASGGGGHVSQSEENHPAANNLAQARGFYDGDASEGGFGLNRVGKKSQTAQGYADSEGFWKHKRGRKASDDEAEAIINSTRQNAENANTAAASKAVGEDKGNAGEPADHLAGIHSILNEWNR